MKKKHFHNLYLLRLNKAKIWVRKSHSVENKVRKHLESPLTQRLKRKSMDSDYLNSLIFQDIQILFQLLKDLQKKFERNNLEGE